MHPKELTLIVATTLSHGIGKSGTLPWPKLKGEMGYFARITKRVGPGDEGSQNAVIMGRRTWESIPSKFRPLAGRFNIVVSSTMSGGEGQGRPHAIVTSFGEAVRQMSSAQTQRVFVIGGASVYGAALGHESVRRVLLTRIREPEFECDTFFPTDLEGGEARRLGWVRRGSDEWRAWTGEEGETEREEEGVKYEFCLYEKETGSNSADAG